MRNVSQICEMYSFFLVDQQRSIQLIVHLCVEYSTPPTAPKSKTSPQPPTVEMSQTSPPCHPLSNNKSASKWSINEFYLPVKTTITISQKQPLNKGFKYPIYLKTHNHPAGILLHPLATFQMEISIRKSQKFRQKWMVHTCSDRGGARGGLVTTTIYVLWRS